jgi:mRNA interferase HigB
MPQNAVHFQCLPLVCKMKTSYIGGMRVIARSTVAAYWTVQAQSREPLENWLRVCKAAKWAGPADVKLSFGTRVDFIGRSRVIFDIGGNKWRIVAVILYRRGHMYIRFVGSHKQYDRIDPLTV